MSNYYNRQWRLPNNENKDKQSNFSMNFDGSSYVDAGNDSSIQIFTGSHSVSAWIYFSSAPSGTDDVYCGYGLVSQIALTSSRTVRYYNLGLTTGTDMYSSTALNTNSWNHVVCTYEVNGNKNIYINGVAETPTSTSGSITSTSVGFMIGARNNVTPPDRNFNGQIDGVAIFDYALSSSQVTTLYGSSSTGIGNPMSLSPKPVAYYPLGDQDAFNGANYLVPNSSLKDYVFSFDGLAEITTGGISGISSNTTVSFWFNNSIAAGGVAPLIASLNYISGTLQNFAIRLETTNKLTVVLVKNNNYIFLNSNTVLANNTWYFVTLTASTSGSNVTNTLYINGTQDVTNTGLNNSNLNDLQNGLTIGHWTATGNQNNFNGTISNVQIFNTALPATGSNSIETLYNNGSPLTSMSGFTSLVGWWKLDASDTYDGTNWTIEDHAGSNDGTSSGMNQSALQQSDLSFTSGYSPYALDFDGVNDYIQTTFNPYTSIGNNTSWTVSSWVYVSNVTTQQRILGTYSTLNAKRFWIGIINSGIAVGYGNRSFNPISGTSVSANSWQNIIVTYSTTTGYILVYVNGSLNGSKNYLNPQDGYANGDEIMANANISIGDSVGDSNFLNGSISNCSVWNAALTSAQVTEIYNEGVPSNLNNHSAYSNLVSWWQLGSNSSFNTNWTVLDEVTASGNNGTSVNMGEDAIVDGVGSYANGTSSGMGGDEVIGDAPYSTANSLSVNMDVEDRVEDTPS